MVKSIRIYLDDDMDWKILLNLLRKNGFEVTSPRDVGMLGKGDDKHLRKAIELDSVVLTSDKNFPDPDPKIKYKGIIKIYQYKNPKKDMLPQQILKALKNIEKLNINLENKEVKLNDFNY